MKKFAHSFKGHNNVPSECNVYIKTQNSINYVLFENLGYNHGQSVTNATEILATEISKLHNLDPGKTLYYETYSEYDAAPIDQIMYHWDAERKASHPSWRPADVSRELWT